VYISPEQLRAAMEEFIEFYNHRRYHEEIGNVAPADVYYGQREAILKRREEQKHITLEERFRYNHSRSATTTMGELSPEPYLRNALSCSQRC
jgi:putative transposase